MKKIYSLLAFSLVLISCDDGAISVQNPNFDSVLVVSKCSENNLLYKTKANDALLWNIDQASYNAAFINDITLDGTPRTIELNSTLNPLIYRAYDGAVLPTKICGIVPDATPNVMEEWKTISGIAEIVTTVSKTTDAATGFEKITGYSHSINFKNVVFQTPNGNRIEPSRGFGIFTPNQNSDNPVTLPFGFLETELIRSDCGTNPNKLVNINGNEALVLNLSATTYTNLFKNQVTTAPLTATLNAENTLNYSYFFGQVTPGYFCATTIPNTPVVLQNWLALNSTSITDGVIEVTTTTSGSEFEHTVRLKKVTLKKGNTTFSLGTSFLLGKFFTN
jgi:hypothetical protein